MIETLFENVSAQPWVYIFLPVGAGVIGYVTKIVAIKMLFEPIEFRGIGPFGWQGLLPRRAGKFASRAVDTLLGDVLTEEEIVAMVDVDLLIAELDEPLSELTDDLGRELCATLHPDLWDKLPESSREAVLARARARAPESTRRVLEHVASDLLDTFDPRYIAVSNMVKNRRVMNEIVDRVAKPELNFMIWTGALFGFLIGLIQAVVWGITQSHIVLPLFGGFVGLFTDYIALHMIFRPHEPTRLFGILPWQGLFFKRREAFTRAYAEVGAKDLLSPRTIVEGVLEGPLLDRSLSAIQSEIDRAVREEARGPSVAKQLAIGSPTYKALRRRALMLLRERTPGLVDELSASLEKSISLEETIADQMLGLDNESYEGLLRPIFKEDEWKVIVVGGILGFMVGELQVFIITHV